MRIARHGEELPPMDLIASAPVAKPTSSETSLAQRQQMVALTAAGWSAPRIAARVGCSVRTVHRWRARARASGPDGLAPRSRRPQTPHPQTTAAPIVERIRAIRQAHPQWGARLIHRQLRLDGVRGVPSERTVQAWLGRLGFGPVRPPAGKPLGWTQAAPRSQQTVWEVDFKKKAPPAP
jgi:transposase